MSKNLRGLSARKGLENSLFGEIKKSASTSGAERELYLSEVSGKYLVGRSSVLSASSFYDFLKSDHSLKKVLRCNGTACMTSDRNVKLNKALITNFGENEIGTVTCLGHCHSGDAFMMGDRICSFDDLDNPGKIISHGYQDDEPFRTGTNVEKPVFIPEITNPKEYYALLNKFANNIPHALREIEVSSLRGRGGAGFPLYIKLKTAAAAVSGKKFVICNADEGDPGAFSDKWLLEKRAHSVLFGMLVSGLITGADTGVIYVRGEYPEAVKSINQAIEEYNGLKPGLTAISGNKFSFSFYLIEGAGAYICGEETSLINSIEGLRPEVRTRPPFPATYGLFGKPTVLSNVETFANLWYILNEGGAAFSNIGTGKSKGTKLVSLDGAFSRPGVYEVVMGTRVKDVFLEMGGGTKYPVKAFQVGGPLGGIVPFDIAMKLTLDFESFSQAGFLLGHAGVVSIPEDFPMIRFLLHLFEFTSNESCGKCFPCRIGAKRGYELLKGALESQRKIDNELFNDLLETMQAGSLCALGGGISLPVFNALSYFSNELEEYFLHMMQTR